MHRVLELATFAAVFACAACAARHEASPSVFLVPDGQVEAGKEAFLELSCFACHAVHGHDDLPEPYGALGVNVMLGGPTGPPPSREALARGIVKSTHRLAPELEEKLADPRMADYSYAMTVRQLGDLVAFLESTWPAD